MRKREAKKYIKRQCEVQTFRLITAQPRLQDVNRALKSTIVDTTPDIIHGFDNFYRNLTEKVSRHPHIITRVSFTMLIVLGDIADRLHLRVTSASLWSANRNNAIN